jgi:hypothetical protein
MGTTHAFDLLLGSEDPDARKLSDAYRSVPASYRRLLAPEAILSCGRRCASSSPGNRDDDRVAPDVARIHDRWGASASSHRGENRAASVAGRRHEGPRDAFEGHGVLAFVSWPVRRHHDLVGTQGRFRARQFGTMGRFQKAAIAAQLCQIAPVSEAAGHLHSVYGKDLRLYYAALSATTLQPASLLAF